MSIARLDSSSHPPQRLHEASHRSPPERAIAVQHRGNRAAGQEPEQETHGRPGVGAIERAMRIGKPPPWPSPAGGGGNCSSNANLGGVAVDAHAETAQAGDGSPHILTGR